MKTSVKNTMMSLALMGCLIFSASDAMAQGRSRVQGSSASSRSQSVEASSSPNKSTAPQVERTITITSQQVKHNTTPQVERTAALQVDRTTTTNTRVPNSVSLSNKEHSTAPTGNTESSGRTGGASTRPGTSTQGGSGNSGLGNDKVPNSTKPHASNTAAINLDTDISTSGSLSIGNNGGTKPGNGGDKPGNGGEKPGNGGEKPGNGGTKPGNGGEKPDFGGTPRPVGPTYPETRPHPVTPPLPETPPCPEPPLPFCMVHEGYGPDNPYDYSKHRYSGDYSWNYAHNNWSIPLPPPSRPSRPSFRGWFSPVIPLGWHANIGAPKIDNILGIPFGTDHHDALDFLYENGYYIDGYANSIVYLRAVPMLGLAWNDVMLAFDNWDRLVNAEFVIRFTRHIHNSSTPCRCANSNSNNNKYIKECYNIVHNSLCEAFGAPIKNSSESVSWYDCDGIGWITLSTFSNTKNYYIMVSIGN